MRYEKNGIFSDKEMSILKSATIAIIGCGGLGGYIGEMLCRVGIGNLKLVDGDVFDETNLNRQILATTQNLNSYKVLEAEKRFKSIDPDIEIEIYKEFLNEINSREIIRGADLVIDALDSIESRLELQSACEIENIPMVYGAIAGWYGQVATIYPGDRLLDKIYAGANTAGIEDKIGNPSFTPANIASIQVSEAIKLLIKKGEILRNKVLYIDLLSNEHEEIEF